MTPILRTLVAAALAAATVAAAAQTVAVLRYAAPEPAGWERQKPASSFRLAQWRVPAAPGAADGEAIAFHFGAGQGGNAQQNTERWLTQFSRPDGQPPTAKTETLRTAGGLGATLVEITGSYARGIGGGPVGASKPDQTLLAAIVEAPEGNVIFQLHGDRATVAGQRDAFVAMVRGLAPPR